MAAVLPATDATPGSAAAGPPPRPAPRTPTPRVAGARSPVQRRSADARRALVGLALLLGAGVAAHLAHPSVVEVNLFRLINQLPSAFDAPLLGVMQLGALAAVPLLALAVAFAGRYRLALAVALSGSLAWSAAKLGQYLVDEEAPQLRLSKVVLHGGAVPGLAFPASHVAVAAALTVAATPYLGRSARRVAWLLTALIAVARVYVGLHLPIDVIGGLGLGVAAGSLALLLLGVPVIGSGPDEVRRLLHVAGIAVDDAVPVGSGRPRFRCTAPSGEAYLVKVLDCDAPDQGWLSRLWRLAAYREVYAPVTPSTPAHRADRVAHAMLLAERAGVRCPGLVATPDLGQQISLVLRHFVAGTPMGELPDGTLGAGAIGDALGQLAALHDAGVVHRAISSDHLLVDCEGKVWLLGWGAARAATTPADRAADRAELLVALALATGPAPVVDAAAAVWGPTVLADTLANLQPLALGAPTRRRLDDRPALVADLRDRIGGVVGVVPRQPVSPTRVALSNLGPIAVIAIAVLVLLPRLVQASGSISLLGHAHWAWFALVVAAAATTYGFASASLAAASGVRLDPGRTYAVELAAACANRVTPAGLGAAATNIRYLELTGIERADATSAVGMTAVSGFIVHTAGTVIAVVALRTGSFSFHVPELERAWPALLGLALAGIGVGWVVWARRWHHALLAWARAGGRALKAVCLRPRRAAVLLGASAGISGCYIVALAGALRAFGAHPGLGVVAGIYLGSSAVGALAPTPGGIGPFEAAAVAGLGGAGVAAAPAVAAVIAYRLLTYWLPVAPGAVALHQLRRRGVL